MVNGKELRLHVEKCCAEKALTPAQVSRRAKRNTNWLYDVFKSENVRAVTVNRIAAGLGLKGKERENFFNQVYNQNGSKEKGAA